MKSLKYRIKLTAPTIISGTSGDSVTNSCLSYIPGTTILGILAGRYLRQYNDKTEFERLFLRRGLIFRNSYLQKDGLNYIPCPKNILQDKQEAAELLILNEYTIKNTKTLLDYKEVNSYINIRKNIVKLQNPGFCLNFHHQRNYATGIPEENVVFNYEALKPDQIFAGEIIGEEKDLQLISEFLKEKEVRIGKSKTAQYGNAEIIDYQIDDFPSLESFSPPIYLYCVSDLILLNEFGYPITSVKGLEKILGVTVLEAYTESGRIESTVAAWKAKKPSYHTLKAGSIFLLEKLPENYKNIQLYGLGERTWEGFGQVKFMELPEEIKYLSDTLLSTTEKPETKFPDILLSILEKTYRKNFLDYVRNEAILDADNVKDYQKVTKSLISKLEGFADNNNFSDLLKQLNKTAKDKLNRVYVEIQRKEEDGPRLLNLNEFLDPTNLNYRISSIRNNFSVIGEKNSSTKLKEEFGLKEIDDKEATEVYLVNFFWFLRKKLAGETKKEENK
jgi:CRISPR-associated protein Csx10